MKIGHQCKKSFVGLFASTRRVDCSSVFPLLSGDVFRLFCSHTWLGTDHGALKKTQIESRFLFVSQANLLSLIKALEDGYRLGGTQDLLIHNGDRPTSTVMLDSLLLHFDRVWSVNIDPSEETATFRWLPVGLENMSYGRVGRKVSFPGPELISQYPNSSVHDRQIEVLASFRVSTNPAVRQPLSQGLDLRKVTWIEPRERNLKRYRKALGESKFVLSPPGNGRDCHRTWEAIYAGAIPVVLKGTIPADICESLPILEVSSFNDFLKRTPLEWSDVAIELNARSREKAFAPYWLEELLKPKRSSTTARGLT